MNDLTKTNARVRGFTLIELVVAMIIISVLAGIAIPTYTGYLNRSKRAAAKSVLVDTANQLERNYTTFGCYNKTSAAVCQTQGGGSDFTLPSLVAPSDGRASYNVAVAFGGATGQQYTLTATPCGTSGTCPAGSDNFVDNDCGSLTLTQAGARAITGTSTVAVCWQR